MYDGESGRLVVVVRVCDTIPQQASWELRSVGLGALAVGPGARTPATVPQALRHPSATVSVCQWGNCDSQRHALALLWTATEKHARYGHHGTHPPAVAASWLQEWRRASFRLSAGGPIPLAGRCPATRATPAVAAPSSPPEINVVTIKLTCTCSPTCLMRNKRGDSPPEHKPGSFRGTPPGTPGHPSPGQR